MIPTVDLIGTVHNNTEEDSAYVDIYHSAESGLNVTEDVAANVPQNKNNNNINRKDSSSTDYKSNFEFIRRNKFEVFTTLISLILAILDWLSDIIQAIAYLFKDELAKGLLTFGSVFNSGLVSLVIFKSRRFKVERTFTYSSFTRCCMSVPSIQSIVLSIKVALVALHPNHYRMKQRARFLDYKRSLQREATIFKRIETILESAPQVLLQLYLNIMALSSDSFSKKKDFLLIFEINAAFLFFFTIFTSIASVSDALRGAYMERFDERIPLDLKLCLHSAAFMKYFLRIAASTLGYVLLAKGTQVMLRTEKWSAIFASLIVAFMIILLPRLAFLFVKSNLENRQLIDTQRPSKFDIILEGAMHFFVSLFTSSIFKIPKSPDSIHHSTLNSAEKWFKLYLFVEPVIHLMYWYLLTHFFSQSNESSQYISFSAIILSSNALHYLIKLCLLPRAVKVYNNCMNDWELVYNSQNTLDLLRSDGPCYTICEHLDKRIRHYVLCLQNYDQLPQSFSADIIMQNINSVGYHPEVQDSVRTHVQATELASLVEDSSDEHQLPVNSQLSETTHSPNRNLQNSCTENQISFTKLLVFYNRWRNRFNIKINFNFKGPDETHFAVELTKSRHIHFLLTYTTFRVVQWILINKSKFSEQHANMLASLVNAIDELLICLRERVIKDYYNSPKFPLPIGTSLTFFQYDERIDIVKKIFYVYHNNEIDFK